jgi:hypothetical protein
LDVSFFVRNEEQFAETLPRHGANLPFPKQLGCAGACCWHDLLIGVDQRTRHILAAFMNNG